MRPAQLHPFRPRLVDTLKDYNRERFVADLGAGITVGIVALPLALAFAIASGVKPEQGLITAIVAGFLISALGGSQVQIGGPAGAFIVIVYGIVERYGFTNLLISTVMAGMLMFMLGLFRLGVLIRYIPVSLVIGFTSGIAVLIALSQLRDAMGLDIAKMPGDFFGQIDALAQHIEGFNVYAFGLTLACVASLVLWPRLFSSRKLLTAHPLGQRPLRVASRLPAPIVALVTLTVAAYFLPMPGPLQARDIGEVDEVGGMRIARQEMRELLAKLVQIPATRWVSARVLIGCFVEKRLAHQIKNHRIDCLQGAAQIGADIVPVNLDAPLRAQVARNDMRFGGSVAV